MSGNGEDGRLTLEDVIAQQNGFIEEMRKMHVESDAKAEKRHQGLMAAVRGITGRVGTLENRIHGLEERMLVVETA